MYVILHPIKILNLRAIYTTLKYLFFTRYSEGEDIGIINTKRIETNTLKSVHIDYDDKDFDSIFQSTKNEIWILNLKNELYH